MKCYTFFVFTANDLSENFEKLTDNSWTLLPIDLKHALDLLEVAEKRENSFRPATTKASESAVKEIRSDRIYWLDEQDTSLFDIEKQTLQQLNYLRNQLQDYFRVSLTNLETHFAIYEKGEKYVRHCDTTSQNNKRVFSFVLYLNQNWLETDGGQLLGYEQENILFRVQPQIGQMILFKSDLEHEVLPAFRKRYSLTGWIRK